MKGIRINNRFQTTGRCMNDQYNTAYNDCNTIINAECLLHYIGNSHNLRTGPDYVGQKCRNTAKHSDIFIIAK